MNLLVKVLLILLITSSAYAEKWICYDNTTKLVTRRVTGDCLRLGVCVGYNNTGISFNCFEATEDEYIKAKDRYVKVDMAAVPGNRVVDMTQTEKDALDAPIIQAQQDRLNLINSLETKFKGLNLTDEEIDYILDRR